MKRIVLLLSFICYNCGVYAQAHPTDNAAEPGSLVHWLTFQEALKLRKVQPKPLLIDFYTDWCGWCKHMMKTTYSTQDVAYYINTYFYPVKFNAEGQDSVFYKDSLFVNKSKYPRSTHNLTPFFLGANLTYPSTVFVSPDDKFTFVSTGYLDMQKIEPFLVYMVENVYYNAAFEGFSKQFNNSFFDTTQLYKKSKVDYLSFEKVQEKVKSKPRKWLAYISTDFCNSCRVMSKSSFGDSAVVKYINDNYYAVDFNAQTLQPITFKGTVYDTVSIHGMPFNKLALALTKNQLVLPSTVVFDENNQIIDLIPRYVAPEMLVAILTFYNENAYKTIPWDKFYKEYQLRH